MCRCPLEAWVSQGVSCFIGHLGGPGPCLGAWPISRDAHHSSANGGPRAVRAARGWSAWRCPALALPSPDLARVLLWHLQWVTVLFRAGARAVQPREGAEQSPLGVAERAPS